MRFPSTNWSLVVSSRGSSGSRRLGPLSELCGQYWLPVFAYLRRRGYRVDEAEDLTQGFFAHLIAKRLLDRADPERGRLRALLLTCLINFVANENGRRRAIKRGGAHAPPRGAAVRPHAMIEATDNMTPERIYELQWALVLLRRVLDQLRAELRAAGKETIFNTLKSYVVGERTEAGYRQAAAALHMTESAARVAVHRLRRRYRELLWMEVGRTLGGSDPDVAGEIRYLLTVVQYQSARGLDV